ncbi:GGDEF domain-containing protein [Candidatus Peregrinibacteria bacterium]|nr:GGDEF domain-containing protein [Candidatus Peregrinibacteria bacterium]
MSKEKKEVKKSERPELAAIDGVFYKTFFESSLDPMFVADATSKMLVEVNDSFLKATGYTQDDIRRSDEKPINLISDESMPYIAEKQKQLRKDGFARYEVKLVKKAGGKIPIELSVRYIKLSDKDYVIGSFRDISQRKLSEQESWERIRQLGLANTRIMTITEKIGSIPDFAQKILDANNETEILERASAALCDRLGMGYENVTFYLVRSEDLWLAYSTDTQKRLNQKLSKDHKFCKILSEELSPIVEDKGGVVPIKDKGKSIGVMEIYFQPSTVEVFKGYRQALKGYQDLMFALAEIIGLRIGNLRLYETVQKQSITDPLTGIFNRRYFDERLRVEIERARRSQAMLLTLMIVDVDNFKDINDAYGHNQGDIVLAEIARILKANMRMVDVVCRYGGDEFAIIMPETPLAGAREKAEQLCTLLKEKDYQSIYKGKQIAATTSIGVAAFKPEMDIQSFVKCADGAMYMAKASGKNQVKSAE